jgi:hypothetical protein
MSSTTLLVLLLLTCGQVLVLGMGFVVLWMAGEFDDGNAQSVSKPRPLRRWALWARISRRRLRRQLRRAVMADRKFSYRGVIMTSFIVTAVVVSGVIVMKAVERSRTASIPIAGATDGLNSTVR